MHKEISAKYPIDKSRVIVGGFSNAGRMAIRLFVNQTFPIHGFLAFSPSRHASIEFSVQKQPGKGAIITGEKDYMLASQMNMANGFLESALPLRLVVLPNHGHDYPKSFSDEVNQSITFLLKK